MALHLYREVTSGTYAQYRVSGEDDYTPISTTHDGILGEVRELKLYVRADTTSAYYTNITVTPESTDTPSQVDGVSSGWGVKLKAIGDNEGQPTEAEWDAVDYGASISIANIGSASGGDTNTYRPFWYRIEVPANATISVNQSIVLTLSYTGVAV